MADSTRPPRPKAVTERWLSLDGAGPLQEQVARALRAEIRDGRLAAGARVPSTRTIAEGLGVSRATVLAAFDQLLAEGYLVGRRGAGTFVAAALPREAGRRREAGPATDPPPPPRLSSFGRRLLEERPGAAYAELFGRPPARFELLYGVPGTDALPPEWPRAVQRAMRAATLRSLAYAPPAGAPALREALAGHLARTRGIRCGPEDVVVTAGAQQAMALACRLLVDPGDAVLVEDPCHLGARQLLASEGARLVPAPVDAEGLDLGRAEGDVRACRLAYVTPSHQYPTGVVLSLARRLALLAWARDAEAFVLEDDYDSELRSSGRPIEALRSLDSDGRVVYVGTFSKTLAPALRIGYLVAPPALRQLLVAARWLADWSAPTLLQEALADLVASGAYARHVRRLRATHARRQAALREALEGELGDAVRVTGEGAGQHLLAWLPRVPADREGELCARARAAGVGVYPVSPYFLRPPPHVGLVLGVTLLDERALREAVRRLAPVVGELATDDRAVSEADEGGPAGVIR